jgi:ZIP family zinc transporter
LAFTGGAMLHVVADKLIPASHSHGYEQEATFGFIAGFTLFLEIFQI